MDAENDNEEHQERTFQELIAYTQGKYRQANALQAPLIAIPKPLSRVRPGPEKYKGGDNPIPILVFGESSPEKPEDNWDGFVAKEQPYLVGPKQVKHQQFRSCLLCQKEGHLSYHCQTISKDMKEWLKRQGSLFA